VGFPPGGRTGHWRDPRASVGFLPNQNPARLPDGARMFDRGEKEQP